MLDPGRYLAEAIYFLQYTLAQLLWAIDRSLLSMAVIAESVNTWVTGNIGYFVQLLVNALSAPLGGMLILALTALGAWYALNNLVPTSRWVDPSKLLTYGAIALFFFSSPIVVIDMMEELRQSLNAGVDSALIDGAAGDIFAASMDGTDTGLPGAIPDVNSDGVIGSFDLAAAFMLVANLDELDSSEFPVEFEAAYFPFGDPSGIDLSDEADQELAKALAGDGIERLFFSLVAVPAAIAEHFLRLSLTGVAVFLYLGIPIAMLFAFFIYTQAFFTAYLRQFINLLIETFMSVIIVAIMIALLAAAAGQGVGLYIGASVIVFFVLLWRIKSALKLAAAAFNLFGGALITGGSGGMEMAQMGRQAVSGAVGLAGTAVTGGAALALGGAVLGTAAALRADNQAGGTILHTDPNKTDNRVQQLKTIAGYAIGRNQTTRRLIEGAHEMRTLSRNFLEGHTLPHDPDLLDYLRVGSSMSGFGSSPWMAMRLSPSLRGAYDEIGGRRYSHTVFDDFDDDEAPIILTDLDDAGAQYGDGRSPNTGSQRGVRDVPPRHTAVNREAENLRVNREITQRFARLEQALTALTAALNSPTDEKPTAPSANTSINGPIPDWLRESLIQPENRSQDVNIISTAPDLDGEGYFDIAQRRREDKYETNNSGTVHLEPYQASRQRAIKTALEQLEEADSPVSQSAYRTMALFTGEANAAQIQTAVRQYTGTAVYEAVEAVANLTGQYREQSMDDAEILAAFQSGAALTAVREVTETPLSDEQLAAVADMTLLPNRRLRRAELAAVIGQQATAGAADEQAVAQAIDSPVDFGGFTGSVRGALAGAQTMRLSPADMSRLANLIRDGLREAAVEELVSRGHRPEIAQTFIGDLAALPGTLIVPQSASFHTAPGQTSPQEE